MVKSVYKHNRGISDELDAASGETSGEVSNTESGTDAAGVGICRNELDPLLAAQIAILSVFRQT